MKQIDGRFTLIPRGLLLVFLFGAITMAGCDSGDSGAAKAPPQTAPVAAPSTTKGNDPNAKKDTTSRRQHQKEQAGTAK
jgi:hypothetical protein